MTTTSRTIRLAAVGLAAGAVLAGTAQSAAAATTTTTEHTSVDFGTFVQTETPCVDEAVQWSGGYETVITTVTGDQTTVRSLQYTQQLTGVGLTSGASYVLNANYHETVRGGTAGADVYIMPEVYVQISKDGSPNYLAHFLSAQIVNANGVVVVQAGDETHGLIMCVG
jgi:hypothetical protein